MAPINLRSSHGNKRLCEFLEAIEQAILACVWRPWWWLGCGQDAEMSKTILVNVRQTP